MLVYGFVDMADVVVLLELLVQLWQFLGLLDQGEEHVGVLLGDLEGSEVALVHGGVLDDLGQEVGDGAYLILLLVEAGLLLRERSLGFVDVRFLEIGFGLANVDVLEYLPDVLHELSLFPFGDFHQPRPKAQLHYPHLTEQRFPLIQHLHDVVLIVLVFNYLFLNPEEQTLQLLVDGLLFLEQFDVGPFALLLGDVADAVLYQVIVTVPVAVPDGIEDGVPQLHIGNSREVHLIAVANQPSEKHSVSVESV